MPSLLSSSTFRDLIFFVQADQIICLCLGVVKCVVLDNMFSF